MSALTITLKADADLPGIGDRAGEAGSLHQIASIDVNQGRYDEARAGFDASLRIRWAIGDRAGEGASYLQLGMLAHQIGLG
jgi:hypothetical protein